MNFNEISSSVSTKQRIYEDEHDLQQSKLKNLLINELKSFFHHRNQTSAPVEQQTIFNSIISKKQINQRIVDLQQILTNKSNQSYIHSSHSFIHSFIINYTEQFNQIIDLFQTKGNIQKFSSISLNFLRTSTTLLASFSFLTNIFLIRNLFQPSKNISNILNLLSTTLFYSNSFIFGYLSTKYVKQRKFFYIQSFLLPTCFKLLSDRQRIFTHQDIFLRIVTSILHLIAGLTIKFDR